MSLAAVSEILAWWDGLKPTAHVVMGAERRRVSVGSARRAPLPRPRKWPLNASLTCYSAGHGHATIVSPQRAYAGMPEDYRIAAAIVDSALRNRWDWVENVYLAITGKAQPTTSTRTERFLESRGWRDVDDIFEAAKVTPAQRWAWELNQAGHTNREIGKYMGTSAHAATLQIIRAREKLERIMKAGEAEEEKVDVECECGAVIHVELETEEQPEITHLDLVGKVVHSVEFTGYRYSDQVVKHNS